MPSLTALCTSPRFAHTFAFVHVLCWPVLWWNLCRFHRWCARENVTDALCTFNRWGLLKVVRLGDKVDPVAYKSPERTFRLLTDVSWGSDLPVAPASLATTGTLRLVPILPCVSGGGGSRLWRESVRTFTPQPNTS